MFLRPSSFRLNPVQLTWVAALFFTTVGNISLWQTLWLQIEFCSIDQVLFFISLPFSLFCCINLFLTPLMILPYLRKPLLVVLVIISAGCTYFMLRYDILIDRNMVQSLFAGATAAKLILSFSMPLALSLFFLGFAAILLALYKDYASLLRDNRHIKDQVVPFNIVRNTHSYLEQKSGVKPHSLRAVAKRASRVVMLSGAKSVR